MICSNIRPQFYEKYYEKLKTFLYRLSKDENLLYIDDKYYINNRVNYCLDCLIGNILGKIFKDNSLISWYLYDNIKNGIIEKLSFSIDKKKEDINKIIENIERVGNINENELKIIFEKELKEKNEDYKELRTTNNDKLLKNLEIKIKNYNLLVNDILPKKIFGFKEQKKIKDILELYDSLSEYEIFLEKEEKNQIIKIPFSLMKNQDIIVQNSNYDDIIMKNKDKSGELYIYADYLYDIILKNKINEILKNIIEKEIPLYIIRIKKNKILENNKYIRIELVFGDEIPLDKFYKDLSNYKNKLKALKDNLIIILKKTRFIV